jgi:anti-sigma factor RsiW
MTRCPDSNQWWAYVLGACDDAQRDALDAHLFACHGCLTQMVRLKRLTEDGAAFDMRPAPRVHEQLRQVVAARRPRRSLWLAVGAAAAAVVLGVLVVRAASQRRAPLPAPAAATDGFVDAIPFNERT